MHIDNITSEKMTLNADGKSMQISIYEKNIEQLQQENQELKKQLEEYKRLGFKHLNDKCNKLENQQKEFISYLENEKDRLARENSQIYEDSLGKTRLVNEDIFNEIDTILSKYKKIIGGKNERRITKNNK